MPKELKCVLSIAGSDSGAGAGIQSDLKTFQNYGVYGTTVITAITSQNTLGVQSTFNVPEKIIDSQLKSILSDFKIAAVKTGMLGSEQAVIATVCNLKNKNLKVIVDPVILSKNKFLLLDKKGVEALKNKLLPITYLVTPNLFEAETLAGFSINSRFDLNKAVDKILNYNCKHVLVKGGHFNKKLGIEKGTDLLYDGSTFKFIRSEFVNVKNTHGIGCTLSAAITANLAKEMQLTNAIIDAKLYIVKSLKKSVRIGKGVSPVEQ
jgi:hydroxymethylpyrimidine kinase/phosphomethylpyrimidine kinase